MVTPVEHQILARKDRGIDSASDLKGKKIAVMRGTSADFFLDSFLIHNGLKHSEVQAVNMLTPEMPWAVEKGEVDAISCWQPFILKAQSRLGNNAIIIPSKNIHTVSWLIVVMRTYAKENPEAIRRFYKAIMKAEKFLTNNREKSIQIHAEMSKTEPEIVDRLLGNMHYDLCLSHQLLLNLENQARWAVRNKYTDKTTIPDYLDFIYVDELEKIKPNSVTIIKGR